MPSAATWDRPIECHVECSKSDRGGEISYDIPYMWTLKRNDINELKKQKQTHRLQEQADGCCWGLGAENGEKGQLGNLGWTCTDDYI